MELLIAITVLSLCLVAVFELVGTSGRQMQKSQNLVIAIGLAHKVAQHLIGRPGDQVVTRPERPIADGPDDDIFNPLENPGTSGGSVRRIRAASLPTVHGALAKHDFRYGINVVGNSPRDVHITISWKEGSQALQYVLPIYVSRQ